MSDRETKEERVVSVLDGTGPERPDCTLVKEFGPHRYKRTPLGYTNLDRVETAFGPRMRTVFQSREAVQPKRRIVRFDRAHVVGTGVVRLPDGCFVRETLQNNREFDAAALAGAFEGVPVREGCFALLRKAGDQNYGHWLVELATRALDFEGAGLSADLRYLVPKYPASLTGMRLDTLAICGIDGSRVEWLDNAPRGFANLHVCTPNSVHSHTHARLALIELRERAWAHAAAGEAATASPYGPKIFIGRPEGHKRRALNEEAAFEECRRHGYVRLDPHGLTLFDQIRIFAAATHVVAVFGASLTNVLWAKPGCRVAALTSDVSADFFFWDLATICGHDYAALFGRAVDPGTSYVHQDFAVDLAVLRDYLALG